MGGQARVFARKDAALVGYELLEKGHIFIVQGVKGEVDLGFGSWSADFHGGSVAFVTAAAWLFRMCFSWHKIT